MVGAVYWHSEFGHLTRMTYMVFSSAKRLCFLVTLFIFYSQYVGARETFASCGESSGYSYYVLGGLIDESRSGFIKDEIKGAIKFTHSENEDWDVVVLTESQEPYSSKDAGANVFFLGGNKYGFNIVVQYPKDTIETYTLRPLTNEVTWTQTKISMMSKTTVYHASCLFE
jgi:hypothetical protein